MDRIAVYPGSFDPVTLGHIDLIQRATQIFDKVIIAVARNTHKTPLFTKEERLAMLRESTKGIPGLEIDSFDGLVIDFARRRGVNILVRGLRMISDFEYEFQMALTNRRLEPKIETVFLMPSENYSFLSSRILKEAAAMGADISSFVPPNVEKHLKERMQR